MTEKLQRRSERKWYWEEADPKTRTIVGALEGAEMSLAAKPSLEKKTASAAMEGFGVSLDYISEIWERGFKELAELKGVEYDPDAPAKAIIAALKEEEPEEAREVIAELGRCASRRPWAGEIASQTADQILGDSPFEAIPALKALSTLAVYRLAVGVPDGAGRTLPFVTPPPAAPSPPIE